MERKQSRRKFLKKSLLGMTGASLVTPSFAKHLYIRNDKTQKPEFVYRTLGNTGMKLPVISMGTGDTNNPNLVKAALDAGIVLLATAQYYGNGNNEKMIGEIIKERDRESCIIMTSVMPNAIDHKAGLFKPETDVELFLKNVDGCLTRLGIECVDIFLLPFTAKRESVFFEPLLRAMENIKKQGKVRFIGIATHNYEQEAIRASVDTKIYDLVMTAYNFRQQNHQELKEAVAYAMEAGLGIIAMKTMAGVYWDKEKKQPINTKAALKWVLQDKNVHTTVPGFTTFDQMYQDISVMEDLELTEKEKLDLQSGLNTTSYGLYCQQCGKCITECPGHLDIPTIMRSYMYAYGYKNLAKARETLSTVDLAEIPCINCDKCKVNCSMDFDIRTKVVDISRLRDIPKDLIDC